jgi:predicted PurR-regulated permease PerM
MSAPRLDPGDRLALRRALSIAVGLGAVALFIAAREALLPFAIGAVVAVGLDVPVGALVRRGVPRIAASAAVVAAALLGGARLATAAAAPMAAGIAGFARDLPAIAADAAAAVRSFIAALGLEGVLPGLSGSVDTALAAAGGRIAGLVGELLVPAIGSVGAVVTAIVGIAAVPLFIFHLLNERERVTDAIADLFEPALRADLRVAAAVVSRGLRRWLRGTVGAGLVVGAATAAGLSAVAVAAPEIAPAIAFVAVTAALLEILPVIGPLIAVLPMAAVAAGSGPLVLLVVLAIPLALQGLKLLLRARGVLPDGRLHPAAAIVAITVGAGIGGAAGAITALPAVVIGRDLLRYAFARLDARDVTLPAAARVVGLRVDALGHRR